MLCQTVSQLVYFDAIIGQKESKDHTGYRYGIPQQLLHSVPYQPPELALQSGAVVGK